jgi:hypothetical protein
MSFDSIRIYENLLGQGKDPEKALIEAKLQSLDNAVIEISRRIINLEDKVGNIKYWILLFVIPLYLQLGSDFLPFILKLFNK